jgi:RimJ/RimL family protein N-acetyltransferase
VLESERLLIRLMELNDLEPARYLHNEESTLNRLSDPFHVSQEEQIEWFKNLSKSRKSRRYSILLKESKELVGIVRMDNIDLVNRSCEIGADILAASRRQGIATEAYTRILDYIFGEMALHRIQLFTLVSNSEAVKLYGKLGFQKEGIVRESIFRGGNFNDMFLMGMLSHEWRLTK